MNIDVYNQIIEKTYIDSIRSALIIDDKFPKYSALLKGKTTLETSDNEVLTPLCNLCEEKNWMLHIENNPPLVDSENTIFSKADIVFLDFSFNYDNGEKAIAAIHHLAQADRFNIVVVYTFKDIKEAFNNVFLSLNHNFLQKYDKDFVDEDIICTEQITSKIQNIYADLLLECYSSQEDIIDVIKRRISLDDFDENVINNSIQIALHELDKKFALPNAPVLEKCYLAETSKNGLINYLKVGNIFVTIIHKDNTNTQDVIIDLIKKAFFKWQPTIGQLILRDAKNQLDNNCYCDALPATNQEAAWFYFTYIKKLLPENEILNNLFGIVRQKLRNRLHSQILSLVAADDKVSDYYKVDDKKVNIYHDINVFVSQFSHAIDGHLHAGTLLRYAGKSETEYWVCLTQPCDLEPDQQSLSWVLPKGKDYIFKPVTLVKLQDTNDIEMALKKSNRGNYVFLKDNDKRVAAYLFNKGDNPDDYQKPHYEIFIAPNKAKYNGDRIVLKKIICDDSKKLIFEDVEFFILGQLRDEYASQLLSKLTAHMSRIATNYISLR